MLLQLLLAVSACTAVLASLCEDTCTTLLQQYKFDTCAKTSPMCCESTYWSQSYALCLEQCSVTERVAAWQAYQGTCGTASQGEASYDSVLASAMNSGVTVVQAMSSPVSSAVEILPAKFKAQHAFQKAKASNQRNSQIFGIVLALFWTLLVAISGAAQLQSRLFDQKMRPQSKLSVYIKKRLLLPALFGYRHAEPISFRGIPLTVMPLRWQACSVLAFVILNLVFLLSEFSVSSAASPVMDQTSQAAMFVGKRSGTMATILIVPLLQFAGRNSLVIAITGWSNDTFRLFHRWTARVLVLDSIVHAAAITILLIRQGGHAKYQAVILGYRSNILGIVAVVISSVILFQALYVFQYFWYEIFLTLHIALAVAFLIAARMHLSSYYVIGYLYAGIALYAVDRLFRVFRILYGNFSGKAEMHATTDATRIVVKPVVPFAYRPGQYACLYVLRFNIWQSNPFSMAEHRDQKYVFIAKRRRGVTAKLHGLAVDPNSHKARIWIEGPYGASFSFEKYDTVLLLAGGIGITPAISYALYLKLKRGDQRVSLIWTVRDEESVGWISSQLRTISENPYLTVHVFVTAGNAKAMEIEDSADEYENDVQDNRRRTVFEMPDLAPSDNRRRTVFEMSLEDDLDDGSFEAPIEDGTTDYAKLDQTVPSSVHFHYYKPRIAAIVRDVVNSDSGSLAVFSCGPVKMVDESRAAVVKNVGDNAKKRIDYFEDAFS